MSWRGCRLSTVAYLQSCLWRTMSSNSAFLQSMHDLFSSFAGMVGYIIRMRVVVGLNWQIEKKSTRVGNSNSGGARLDNGHARFPRLGAFGLNKNTLALRFSYGIILNEIGYLSSC
jgi:hypothetical protein